MKSGYKACKNPSLCGVKSHRLGTMDAKCMKAGVGGGSSDKSVKLSTTPSLSSAPRAMTDSDLYEIGDSLGDYNDDRMRNPEFVKVRAEARGIPLEDAMAAAKYLMDNLDEEIAQRSNRHEERADDIISKTPAGTTFKRGMIVVVNEGSGDTVSKRIVKLSSVRSAKYGGGKIISGDTIDAYEDIYVEDWEDKSIITS